MAVMVMCVGIIAFGMLVYLTLPRENFPEVKTPYVTVTTVLDGATPEDVETALTIPLETELVGVEGLHEMKSKSSESLSLVIMEFEPEVETQVALQRTRDAVDAAKGDLPAEAEETIVKEFSINDEFPVLVLNLVGPDSVTLSELKELAERIQDELETVNGVLSVKIAGGREREIHIVVDPERLHYYHLTLAQVQAILRGTNHNVSAGAAVLPDNRLVMRAPGEFESAAEIYSLVVGAGEDATPIYMRDVATVTMDFAEEESRARLYDFTDGDGERSLDSYVEPATAISIMVTKKTGANILHVIDDSIAVADSFSLPEGVELKVISDLSKEVKMMVSDLENGIGTSLILVLAVIFVGLGARNAFLTAWAIPFSMLLSIVVLALLGFTLNNMVLYSLILALGMLVDNAIVIVENIYRHLSMGAPRAQAALKGTSEVAWPVIASTATTVGAFLPIVFWPGIVGEFMSYLPKTVIIVLLSSLFVALVINPTMCSLIMKVKKGAETTIDPETERPTYPLARAYGRLLDFMLDHPGWTLTTAFMVLLAVSTAYGVLQLGVEFFPTLDPKRVVVSVTPPDGTSIDRLDRYERAAEDRLFGVEGSGFDAPIRNLKHVGATMALEGGNETGPGVIRIEFVDRDYRTEDTSDTLSEIRARLEGLDREGGRVTHPLVGAEYDAIVPPEGPPTGKPVSIDIFGEDLTQMTQVVYDMKEIMTGVQGVAKPTDDAATAQPTLEWRVDKGRAGMVGLDQATVTATLQMAVGGLKTGTFGHGDDEQDIVVKLPEQYRTDTRQLKGVEVPAPGGGSVPLASVASSALVPGPVQIRHLDRKRVLNAGAEVEPWVEGDATVRKEFQERVGDYTFPQGIAYNFGGAAEDQAESQAFLSKAFLIALFVIAMILVLQFNSIAIPAIVLCSVLLSFIGVFLGLITFHMPFGIIMSGIGVISLAGIVVNNGIVLLDAIRQIQARGVELREAVTTASMIRLRPVLLTATTTILGLLPMAAKLNIDFLNLSFQYDTESSQWWQSMAVVVIFGLLVSTVLTLGVVPTLYLLYERARRNLSAKLGFRISEDAEQLESVSLKL